MTGNQTTVQSCGEPDMMFSPAALQAEQQQTPFTMQDGYRSNTYLNISVRDNARITCEALKSMSSTELTKLWKVLSNTHLCTCRPTVYDSSSANKMLLMFALSEVMSTYLWIFVLCSSFSVLSLHTGHQLHSFCIAEKVHAEKVLAPVMQVTRGLHSSLVLPCRSM